MAAFHRLFEEKFESCIVAQRKYKTVYFCISLLHSVYLKESYESIEIFWKLFSTMLIIEALAETSKSLAS